jgi:hypothetical protein
LFGIRPHNSKLQSNDIQIIELESHHFNTMADLVLNSIQLHDLQYRHPNEA